MILHSIGVPLGIINRNPLNIKQNHPEVWVGSDLENPQDRKGHAIFIHPLYCYRSSSRQLWRYRQDGKRSLYDIISTWAPSNDGNDPLTYANELLHDLNDCGELIEIKNIHDALPLFKDDGFVDDSALLENLFFFMACYETAAWYHEPMEFIRSGIGAYESTWGGNPNA